MLVILLKNQIIKISEIEGKIPNISGLATTSALTAVENKIRSVTNLVKKTDYNTKISELEKKITDYTHNKYITTPQFNKLTAKNFSARLAQGDLITKTDFDAKLSSLNRKITSNKLVQFYPHPSGGTGRNTLIFGVDMRSSIKIDNKGKDVLILGKGPTQGLGEHSLSAEKMYSINFIKVNTVNS